MNISFVLKLKKIMLYKMKNNNYFGLVIEFRYISFDFSLWLIIVRVLWIIFLVGDFDFKFSDWIFKVLFEKLMFIIGLWEDIVLIIYVD